MGAGVGGGLGAWGWGPTGGGCRRPLKLGKFGWSVDEQGKLRLACDAIISEVEEELVEAYMDETDVTFKKRVCGSYCAKARMPYLLNVWSGLDMDGNAAESKDGYVVGTQGAVYVEGRVDAKALRTANQAELDAGKAAKRPKRKQAKGTRVEL